MTSSDRCIACAIRWRTHGSCRAVAGGWRFVLAILASAGCAGPSGGDDTPVLCPSTDPFVSETTLSLTHHGVRKYPSSLSSDELTAYYSVRDGEVVAGEPIGIFAATRVDRDQPFVDGVLVAGLEAYSDTDAEISSDGLELVFDHYEAGTTRLYRTTRPRRDAAFAPPAALPPVADAFGASMPADDSELFYMHTPLLSASNPEIRRAPRVGGTFSEGAVVYSQVSPDIGRPVVSADGLTLYFVLPSGLDPALAYLRRPTRTEPFWTSPEFWPGPERSGPLWESRDGCRLYVTRGDRQTVILSRGAP